MKLQQLLLVEEFKKFLPNEVKTYLDEHKAETLQQAATLADDYTLTYQRVFLSQKLWINKFVYHLPTEVVMGLARVVTIIEGVVIEYRNHNVMQLRREAGYFLDAALFPDTPGRTSAMQHDVRRYK